MRHPDKEQLARQIDDDLDLYNYAVRIGDAEWQADILARLQERNDEKESAGDWTFAELLQAFDLVNDRLLVLYSRLHKAESKEEADLLWAEVWELKDRRIALMHAFYPHSKCSSSR